MLKKEFEERVGRSVSEEEFVEINAMYMSAGDIDKDTFCREWKRIGESELLKGLFETAYNLNQSLQEHKLQLKEADEIRSDAADMILEEVGAVLALADESEDCRPALEIIAFKLTERAWWLVGQKEVVKRKAKLGIRFSGTEVEYIINNLK